MMATNGCRSAQAIAILGTASDVGKTVIAAGICRLLYRRGFHVAPFKAQNMSLNSCATPEGGEIGRAQALQAQACGLPPHVDMNPVLLKPHSDTCAQVVVQGKAWNTCEASAYFDRSTDLWRVARESYDRLARRYDVVVIEGAGSAAEVNLRDRDFVNWPIVEHADASVVLIAGIDRGGVFAQTVGTLDLLPVHERRRVIGIVVNKFRGDRALFVDGVMFLESRTGIPVLGVLPLLRDLRLDEEDNLASHLVWQKPFGRTHVNIAVPLIPHLSNFTDFTSLAAEDDVALRYGAAPEDLVGADVVILPGSKSTIADLRHLRERGFFEEVLLQPGREVVGICGGYQMLGTDIADPHGVETGERAQGLGLLDVGTELSREKVTTQVRAVPLHLDDASDSAVIGYQIHMGVTSRRADRPCFCIHGYDAGMHGFWKVPEGPDEGAVSANGLVWGTYIHGVFDQPGFRRAWLNRVRRRKALTPLPIAVSNSVTGRLAHELNRWADHLEEHVALEAVWDRLR